LGSRFLPFLWIRIRESLFQVGDLGQPDSILQRWHLLSWNIVGNAPLLFAMHERHLKRTLLIWSVATAWVAFLTGFSFVLIWWLR